MASWLAMMCMRNGPRMTCGITLGWTKFCPGKKYKVTFVEYGNVQICSAERLAQKNDNNHGNNNDDNNDAPGLPPIPSKEHHPSVMIM